VEADVVGGPAGAEFLAAGCELTVQVGEALVVRVLARAAAEDGADVVRYLFPLRVGHMAVKLAHAMGADVTVLFQSLKKHEDGLNLGADSYYATSDPATFEQLAGTFDLIINTDTGEKLDVLSGLERAKSIRRASPKIPPGGTPCHGRRFGGNFAPPAS
jgi:hypothetical protein